MSIENNFDHFLSIFEHRKYHIFLFENFKNWLNGFIKAEFPEDYLSVIFQSKVWGVNVSYFHDFFCDFQFGARLVNYENHIKGNFGTFEIHGNPRIRPNYDFQFFA